MGCRMSVALSESSARTPTENAKQRLKATASGGQEDICNKRRRNTNAGDHVR